jgi:hypothetical protein
MEEAPAIDWPEACIEGVIVGAATRFAGPPALGRHTGAETQAGRHTRFPTHATVVREARAGRPLPEASHG